MFLEKLIVLAKDNPPCKKCELKGVFAREVCCDYISKIGTMRPTRNITECPGYSYGIRMMNKDDGEIKYYRNIKIASKENHISESSIKAALNGNVTNNNIYWKRVIVKNDEFSS